MKKFSKIFSRGCPLWCSNYQIFETKFLKIQILEQLERVEGNLDQINADMKEAEEHLKGMEKCCGLCVLPWNRNDDFEKGAEYAKTWKKDDDGGVISDQPRITVGDSGMGPTGGFITR